MTDQPTATDQPDPTAQPDQSSTRTESTATQWMMLQRTVAVALIVLFAITMLVGGHVIPPLAIAGVLVASLLMLTRFRPRAGALGIGVFSGVWLVLVLLGTNPVLATLARPSETVQFMISLGMIVLPVTGLVGLIGVLRRASSRIAVRTLQALGTVLLGGLVLSLLVGL